MEILSEIRFLTFERGFVFLFREGRQRLSSSTLRRAGDPLCAFSSALPWSAASRARTPRRASSSAPPRASAVLGRHDTSNFPGLVLGWINADFRVQIRIFQHFSRSSRISSSRKQICKLFAIFFKMSQNFAKKRERERERERENFLEN